MSVLFSRPRYLFPYQKWPRFELFPYHKHSSIFSAELDTIHLAVVIIRAPSRTSVRYPYRFTDFDASYWVHFKLRMSKTQA